MLGSNVVRASKQRLLPSQREGQSEEEWWIFSPEGKPYVYSIAANLILESTEQPMEESCDKIKYIRYELTPDGCCKI